MTKDFWHVIQNTENPRGQRRTLRSEFPDYDFAELQVSPLELEPWHNDACPRYNWRPEPGFDLGVALPVADLEALEGSEITLLVDYADPAKREDSWRKQFAIELRSADEIKVLELEGDSLEELRAKLNTLYARRCGHSPDQQAQTETGQVLPFGELAVVVGCFELDELRRAASLDDNQRSYGPAGPSCSCEGIDDGP